MSQNDPDMLKKTYQYLAGDGSHWVEVDNQNALGVGGTREAAAEGAARQSAENAAGHFVVRVMRRDETGRDMRVLEFGVDRDEARKLVGAGAKYVGAEIYMP
jgi:hypothetical protein